MTRSEKVQLIQRLFQQVSNYGVLTWGPVENGYRWTCEDHGTAERLAKSLLDGVRLLKLDVRTFPYRYQPEGGGTLIIEPVED